MREERGERREERGERREDNYAGVILAVVIQEFKFQRILMLIPNS